MSEAKKENETFKFKGKVKYAIVPPSTARKPSPKYIKPLAPNDTFYSIQAPCSQKDFDLLIKKGIPSSTKLKKDEEDGQTYITVKAVKIKRVDGVDKEFYDPFVVDKAGHPVTTLIGNGSECIVITELASYGTDGEKALRLKGLQVLDLVPYVAKTGVNKYKDLLEIDETATLGEEPPFDVDDESLDDFT